MKKICLTFIAVLSVLQFTYAQWATSGNNINNTNIGNVLITGTTYSISATTGALQVAGGIGAGGYSTFNKGIEISGAWNPSGVNYVFGTMINAFNADANAVSGIYGLGVNLSTFAASYTTTQIGLLALSPINKGAGHTIITATGISMGNTSAGTNNTNFLIGPLLPTGNYSIYNASAYQNYFAGSLGLLTAAPTHTFTLGSSSNGVAAYNTADQVTNYERAVQYWTANTYTFTTQAGGTGVVRNFAFTGSGNVLIGKSSQTNSSYKLDVNGNVRANEIVVNTSGADFVFDHSYHLPSLSSLEKYISQNHHLPEIAPAKQMQADGLDLGNNQVKLLQKVEELTLYMIEKDNQIKKDEIKLKEQDKDNREQLAQLKAQQNQINELRKQVEELIKSRQ